MNKIIQQKEHFERISEKYYNSRQNKNHLFYKKMLWGYFFKNKEFLRRRKLDLLKPMCGYAEGKGIVEDNLGVNTIYEGFDYSENLVEKINKKYPKLNVYNLDVTKFRPEKKYDLVIIIGGLHHVPSYTGSVISNIHKGIKKNGHFITFEPTQNNWFLKKVREVIYSRNDFFDNETEKAFDLSDMNKQFIRNGFKIKDQIYPGLLSYILYYNPDVFPFLNKGGRPVLKLLFSVDKLFFRNIIGKKMSFATLTLWEKDGN